jgi:hypothetical protein
VFQRLKLEARDRWEDQKEMGGWFQNESSRNGIGSGDWIDLTQDKWRAFVNTVLNIRSLQNVGHFLTSWETTGFWKQRTLLYGVSQQFVSLRIFHHLTVTESRLPWCYAKSVRK